MVECRTGTSLRQVRFTGTARDFSPRVNFLCRLFRCPLPPCAIACINVCAHVKDPVVHVRGWWVIETLNHPECTVGWVVRHSRSWLSQGKATRISRVRDANGTIQLLNQRQQQQKTKKQTHTHTHKKNPTTLDDNTIPS